MIDLLPPTEAAGRLDMGLRAIQRAALEGALPAVRFGRLLRVSLEPLPVSTSALMRLLEQPQYTAAQLAESWHLHVRTLHRLAARGEIPLRLRAGQWVISRRALAVWLCRGLGRDV